MSVVVLGSSGQLATHLREILPQARFLSRVDADLADAAALERALLAAQASFIVNAAAYTAVDRAESEQPAAWAVNAGAPAVMATIAAKLNVPLVHVSTDYVFGGHSDAPWRVNDPVNPVSVYARTKLAGELAVATLCARHWILRTSWVFSEHGANFVKTMLRLAAQRPELRVVNDQRGRPTYARDLALLIAKLASSSQPDAVLPYGLHHATGGPAVSWREFADAIVEAGYRLGVLAQKVPVIGITTAEYPTPAKRPSNSVLEPTVYATGITFDWQAGLERVIANLKRIAA
jgi:dTDP-4-dehydrorhamnose reductase